MKIRYLILIFFLTLMLSVAKGQKRHYSLSFEQTEYSLNKNNYQLLKGIYKNNSKNDLVLWIDNRNDISTDKLKEVELKNYLLKQNGDYSLMNLIAEKLLSGNNIVIFKTFIKVIKPGHKFEINVLVEKNEMKQLKINACNNFLRHNVILLDKEKSILLKKLKFNGSMEYQGNSIVIPATDLSL